MGVIAKGILRGCQGLFTPVPLGYPLSVFNKKTLLSKLLAKLPEKFYGVKKATSIQVAM